MRTLFTLFGITLLLAVTYAGYVSLNTNEIQKLKDLIGKDRNAAKQYIGLKNYANSALSQKPGPIGVYSSAGRLAGDPIKAKSAKASEDYHKMYALAFAYKIEGDQKFLKKLREFFSAWAKINHSNGNPVDDRLMDEVIEAYDLVKDDLDDNVKTEVQKWLRQFAEKEMYNSQVTPGSGTGTNNWNANRHLIIGYVGVALQDKKIINWVTESLEKFLPVNLNSDGSSFDFNNRDALHYHVFNLKPLIKLAISLKRNGLKNYYSFKASNGASMEKSTNWMTPYITGQKTHAEYANSKVDFDRKRAANGEKGYEIGHPWGPKESIEATAPACFFQPSLIQLVGKVSDNKSNFPTWENVLNAVRQGLNN